MRRNRFFGAVCAGVLAVSCASGPATREEPLQWPPAGVAAPGVVHWLGEFSDLRSGGFSRFFQAVAGVEGEDHGRRLARPVAVALGDDDRVAIADTWFGAVIVCDLDGGDAGDIVLPAGARPNSVDFTPDGRSVLIGDGADGTIYRAAADGAEVDVLLPAGVLERCGDVVAADRGGVFATDPRAGRIVRVSADGTVTRSRGGDFNTPTALAAGPDGTLWMVDTFNFRVVHLDRDLEILGTFGRHGDASGDFALPKGIAVDAEGHVYVSDGIFDVVQVFDSDGRLLLVIGGHGTGPGRFLNPAGMAFGRDGTLATADTGNRRVQVFDYRSRKGEG